MHGIAAAPAHIPGCVAGFHPVVSADANLSSGVKVNRWSMTSLSLLQIVARNAGDPYRSTDSSRPFRGERCGLQRLRTG